VALGTAARSSGAGVKRYACTVRLLSGAGTTYQKAIPQRRAEEQAPTPGACSVSLIAMNEGLLQDAYRGRGTGADEDLGRRLVPDYRDVEGAGVAQRPVFHASRGADSARPFV
jgi:hypothetical protein